MTLVQSLNQTNMLSRVWRTRFVVQDVSAALQDFSSTPTTDRSFTGLDIALGHVVIYNTFRLSSWSRKWFCSWSQKSRWIKTFLISWQETAATQSLTQSPTRLFLTSVLGSDPHTTDSADFRPTSRCCCCCDSGLNINTQLEKINSVQLSNQVSEK